MGYTTYFDGAFDLDSPLSAAQVVYLKAFNNTRRMKRDAEKLAERPDPVREAVGLPIGPDGAYFVGSGGFHGQEHSDDVVEYNHPPKGQPGLWCQWVPTENGEFIVWDDGEKFYNYVEWLEYIIEHFLRPWGKCLTGKVRWSGEEGDDRGVIVVTDNVVETSYDVITNPLDEEQTDKMVKAIEHVLRVSEDSNKISDISLDMLRDALP